MTNFASESCESIGQPSESLETSTTSMAPNSEECDYLQEDFLANHIAKPGSSEARTITGQSGRKCSELLRKHDRVTSWAKTLLASSTWNSTTCFLRWNHKVTPRKRLLFQLAPSMPNTDATGFGYLGPTQWQTPQVANSTGGQTSRGGGTQGGIAFDGSGEALADPDESMRQRQHPSQGSGQSGEQSQGRDDIAGDGEALADPNCGGRTSSKHTRGGTTKDCGGKENTVTGDCALADPNDPRRTQQRPAKPARTQLKTPQRPSEWAIEPNICRMAHGIPNRVHRLRGLGNSIVSQVAEEIIRAIPE